MRDRDGNRAAEGIEEYGDGVPGGHVFRGEDDLNGYEWDLNALVKGWGLAFIIEYLRSIGLFSWGEVLELLLEKKEVKTYQHQLRIPQGVGNRSIYLPRRKLGGCKVALLQQ